MKTQPLADEAAYKEAIAQPAFLLFKHSPMCGVSGEAANQYNKFMESRSVPSNWVDVIAQRPLSRWIAEETGIRHQSPQVILFRDGKVVWHASHWEITNQSLEDAVRGESVS